MRDENGKKIASKKVQNKREVRDFILARANALPPQWEDHAMSRRMKGSEILNTPKLLDALTPEKIEEIKENSYYDVPYTMSRPVNHFERMWNLAKKGGPRAAAQYYDEVLRMTAEVMQGNKIGGIQTELDYGSAIRNF